MTENMMDIGDIEFGAELTLDEMNEISGGPATRSTRSRPMTP